MKSRCLTEPEQCRAADPLSAVCTALHQPLALPWWRGQSAQGQNNSQGNIKRYPREEQEPFPPLSGSSNEIQRAETMPERAMRPEWQTNPGKCLSQQWQSQGKSSTRCSSIPPWWKEEELLPSTALCWCWAPACREQHTLQSQLSGPGPASQGTGSSLSTLPSSQQESHSSTSIPQSHRKNTQPSS